MKLLLTSAGFRTEDMVDACVRLSGTTRGKLTFAIINEGYAAEPGDKRWVFDQLSAVAELFPGQVDLVSLLAFDMDHAMQRLAASDVIFVVGGHTDYLMHVFRTSGFAARLPELLETKVYVGSSAGAMILGKRLSDDAYAQLYDEHEPFGVSEYLGIVNAAIAPHLNRPDFPNLTSDTLQTLSRTHDGLIYGLTDLQAIAITGKKTQFVGGRPVCVSGGKLLAA